MGATGPILLGWIHDATQSFFIAILGKIVINVLMIAVQFMAVLRKSKDTVDITVKGVDSTFSEMIICSYREEEYLTMNILILGATGRVGLDIVALALMKRLHVTALVRTPAKMKYTSENLTPIQGNALNK